MNWDAALRLATFTLLILIFSASGRTRRKADRTGKDEISFAKEGRFIYNLRVSSALVFYLSLLAWLIYPPLIAWASVPVPLPLRLAGFALAAAMAPLLLWMLRSLGDNITPTVVVRQDHQLVTHGPYKWIRHPLYTFGSTFFIGVSIAAQSLLMLAAGLAALVSLILRTRIEEEKLEERFGDAYREYKARTGQFLPKLLNRRSRG
ncbi:MAG: isoprenylcysteine carboxylmethyltransferase family protein [Anaerolineae bacterium]|nr:MAG: isoprenylcysteine carboxylmethyltransferase family protein [Anaerolineae bacterium]